MYPFIARNPFALQRFGTWPSPARVRGLLRAGLRRIIIHVDEPGEVTIFSVIPQEETRFILAVITCRGDVVYNSFVLPRAARGAIEMIVFNRHHYVGTAFKARHRNKLKVTIYNYLMDRGRYMW